MSDFVQIKHKSDTENFYHIAVTWVIIKAATKN